jgi:hypothetical protein
MSKLNYLDPEVGGCWGFKGRDGSSQAAEDGTELHERTEAILREYLKAARPGVSLGAFANARKDWDDDSDALLQFCFRYLESVLRAGVKVYIELKARVKRDDGTEINYGHLDLLLVYPDGSAKLIDWKFGYVPVLPANINRQGIGYAAAMFQQFAAIRAIEVVFVQPRCRWVTSHTFNRVQAAELGYRVDQIVANAIKTQSNWKLVAADVANPGAACEYCARVVSCPGYLRKYSHAIQRMGGLDLPTTLDLDAIDTPEKAAVARAWVDFLDLAAAPIKERAEEYARAHGGVIEATLSDGRVIRYEMRSRGINRELGSAAEIAEALKDFVDPKQLLGAAKLSLEKTLEICAPALMEISPEVGTKKAARENVLSLLEAHGLITKPDGKVEYLKRSKVIPESQKPTKTNKNNL